MDTEERLRNLELSLAKKEGFYKAIGLGAAIAATFILGFFGYESWYAIPKHIDSYFHEEVEEQVRLQASKLDEKLQQSEDKLKKFNNRITTEMSEGIAFTEAQTNQIATHLEARINKLVPVIERLEKLGSVSQNGQSILPTTPVLVFDNSWVKSGYYLPVEDVFRIYVKNIYKHSADIWINRVSNGETVAKKNNMMEGESLTASNGATQYSIQLKNIGKAGYNPFTLACYFRVDKVTGTTEKTKAQ